MRNLYIGTIFLIFSSCTTQTADQLHIETVSEGTGPAVKKGDVIWIEETTSYSDGTLIFSTDQIGSPLKFEVGANQVIEGVDQGVIGMRKGGVRKLIVPPSLSKRKSYPDSIHPDSTLYYSITLVEIEKGN